MRKQIRIRGEQKQEFELERLAHALLRAAREADKQRKSADARQTESRDER